MSFTYNLSAPAAAVGGGVWRAGWRSGGPGGRRPPTRAATDVSRDRTLPGGAAGPRRIRHRDPRSAHSPAIYTSTYDPWLSSVFKVFVQVINVEMSFSKFWTEQDYCGWFMLNLTPWFDLDILKWLLGSVAKLVVCFNYVVKKLFVTK